MGRAVIDERSVLQARQGVSMIQAEGLRVVDEQMADVPADASTMGEIIMRGNNVMVGYYLDPEATAEAFRGGWFHSGDLGVMHPDGYIELRDRIKDIVISGGETISTVEVEQALMSHPAVLEAAVIGVPDNKWGERPKAFVVLRAGHNATPDEPIAHVRTKIARSASTSAHDGWSRPITTGRSPAEVGSSSSSPLSSSSDVSGAYSCLMISSAWWRAALSRPALARYPSPGLSSPASSSASSPACRANCRLIASSQESGSSISAYHGGPNQGQSN